MNRNHVFLILLLILMGIAVVFLSSNSHTAISTVESPQETIISVKEYVPDSFPMNTFAKTPKKEIKPTNKVSIPPVLKKAKSDTLLNLQVKLRPSHSHKATLKKHPTGTIPTNALASVSRNTLDGAKTKGFSITAEVKRLNSDTSLNFLNQFPSGHVSKATLKKYLSKNEDGYTLSFNSKSAISTPTIANDRVFTSGGFGSTEFYAFDLKTGKLDWGINLHDDGPSSAVCSDSLIFFNTESCTIFAINQFSGKQAWSLWLGDPLQSTPAYSDGFLYTAYPDLRMKAKAEEKGMNALATHPLACLNAKDGSIVWQRWLDGDVMISPVVHDGFVYVTTNPGTVYKLDKADGNIIAAMALRATSPPSLFDKKVYLTKRTDTDGPAKESVVVLSQDSLGFVKVFHEVDAPHVDQKIQSRSSYARQAKNMDAGNGFGAGAPITSGATYAATNIGRSSVSSIQQFQPSTVLCDKGKSFTLMGEILYCLDPINEAVLWSHQFDGDIRKSGGSLACTPILSTDHIVTVSLNGMVLVFEMETGEIVLSKQINKQVRASPVMKDGLLLIPTTTGEIVSIATGIEELDGWPMLMKNSAHVIN